MQEAAHTVVSSYLYSQNKAKAHQYVSEHIPRYKIDDLLSDRQSTVLHNRDDNKTVIAHRGTQWKPNTIVGDLVADGAVALGLHNKSAKYPLAALASYTGKEGLAKSILEHYDPSLVIKQFKSAEDKYQKTKHKYPDSDIEATGHSLGANISYHLATKHNITGHHMAIGSTPLQQANDIVNSFFNGHKPEYVKQHIYHADAYKGLGTEYVGTDPISQWSEHLAGTHHRVKTNAKTLLEVHDLSQFVNHHDADVKSYKYRYRPDEKITDYSKPFTRPEAYLANKLQPKKKKHQKK